jgi:hypothetical protein
MIDWQIHVDGRLPPGWDPHTDGCWFPDFGYQDYLLPYFDVGATRIDEYGSTEFKAADLQRLRDNLAALREKLAPEREAFKPGARRLRANAIPKGLDRKKVLQVIDKTLAMIELALERGGTFVFGGD